MSRSSSDTKPHMNATNVPLKLMMKDVPRMRKSVEKQGYAWEVEVVAGTNSIALNQIWLQGRVKTVEDATVDTISMSDGTGNVTVSKVSRVPGDRSWIAPGAYCGLMAVVLNPQEFPPLVSAIKLMHITNRTNAEEMWPLEVEEVAKFLCGKIIPAL